MYNYYMRFDYLEKSAKSRTLNILPGGLEKQAGPLNKKLYNIFKPIITRQPRITLKERVNHNSPFEFDKGPEVTIDRSILKNFSNKRVAPSIRYADLSVPTRERLKALLAQRSGARTESFLDRIMGFIGFKRKKGIPSKYYNRPETPRQQASRLANRLKAKMESSNYDDSINLTTLLAANDLRNGYSYRRRWSPKLPFLIRARAKAPFVGVPDFTHPTVTRYANDLAKAAPDGTDYIKVDSNFLKNLDNSGNETGLIASSVGDSFGQDLRILRPGEPHIDGKTIRTHRYRSDGKESVYETMNLPNSEISNISGGEIYMPYNATVEKAMREAGITPQPITGTSLWGDQGTLFRGSSKENLLKEVPENLYSAGDASKVTSYINSIRERLNAAGGLPQPNSHSYIDWRWYTPSLRRAVGYMGDGSRERGQFVRVPISVYRSLAKSAPKNPGLPTVDDFSTLDRELKTIYQDNRLPSMVWSKL